MPCLPRLLLITTLIPFRGKLETTPGIDATLQHGFAHALFFFFASVMITSTGKVAAHILKTLSESCGSYINSHVAPVCVGP
ncbi:hypothetical protein BC826DRAFT_1040686 [Russula brevipes]|nr:hypothetical protein BC826DRAFT_1040686 [Russula brevipes]